MKEFFRTFFAVLLAQVVLGIWLVVVVMVFAVAATSKGVDVPKGAFLVQRISGEIPEYVPPSPFPSLKEQTKHLTQILENLDKARVDDRIRGVVLELGSSDMGLAKRQEIRKRIQALREAGKPVYAFVRYLGTSDYYLATACDSIFMPPEGLLDLHGLAAEVAYLKGTLEALGIKPNLHRIAEYKSAAEPLLRENMSKETRENLRWILEDIFDTLVGTIATDRGMEADELLALMEETRFTAQRAKEKGLVDEVLFWEDLEDRLKGDQEEWKTIRGGEYAKVSRKKVGLSGDKKVAIVHAQGVIAGGQNGYVFPFGAKMGSATMTRILDEIREDDDIDGVIFRIDSPGGESLASDEISYAVHLLSREKPTVVSMVDVAGSGGYMIAYRCSTLVALPATITGSIGSITAKFNMRGFYKHLGITKDFEEIGPNARINSDYRDYTEREWEIVRSTHWESYDMWVRQVAEMRGLSLAAMDTLARGRVWTGRQAKERRLVDEVGGLDEALALLKAKMGIPEEEGVEFVHYPKPKSFLDRILESGSVALRLVARLLRPLGLGTVTDPSPFEMLRPSMLEAYCPVVVR
jgi:protease-4